MNRLIYNKESDQIVEFQELFQQEMTHKMKLVEMDDDLGRFTSQHHMAIEAAIRKIKMILEANRQRRAALQAKALANELPLQDDEPVQVRSSQNIKKSSMYKMFNLALKTKKKVGSDKKLLGLTS